MEFMTAGPMSAGCEGSESLHRSSCDCSNTLPLEDGGAECIQLPILNHMATFQNSICVYEYS